MENTLNLIAECAKEHRGDIHKAKEMIRKAKISGFTHVKFQAYSLDDISKNHTNYDRYRNCWFNLDQLKELKYYADDMNIIFFCSVFSKSLIPELAKFTDIIKVPSTFLVKEEFVKCCLDNFKQTHISTGMNNLDDITHFYRLYSDYLTRIDPIKKLVFYHCTSEYPTPPERAKLSRLQNPIFNGYSDHTVGIRCVTLSYLFGIEWIEKHFSLDLMAHSWCANEIEMIKCTNILDKLTEYLHDDELISDIAKSNYEFFKTEFKDLL